MPDRILVMGASGSGTTTLGLELGKRLGVASLDTDNYFWLPTEPPFKQKRPRDERLARILADMSNTPSSVVSGCVMGWGAAIEDTFTLIVFLGLDTPIRIARLRARELAQLGHVDETFIQWAAEYEDGPSEGRSRALHESWLIGRRCPVLRLEGDLSVADRADRVVNEMVRRR